MVSLRRYRTFAMWMFLFAKTCLSMKELSAQEGKNFTLTCTGNITDKLKHIWWTSKRLLSICYIGKTACINHDSKNYIATISHVKEKYSSKLTIHNVGAHHRNDIFNCTNDVDIGTQPFLLRVYHVPEDPICKSVQLSHGRIKVTCETLKVFPTIICDFSQEIYNFTDGIDSHNTVSIPDVQYTIKYQVGTTGYNTATCSVVVCPRLPGMYRFKVKMYPNITNHLVTSVDGYTDFVTIHSPDNSCRRLTKVGKDVETENETMVTVKVKELIGEESSRYTGGKIIDSKENSLEHTCKNGQDAMTRLLSALLILTCLLAGSCLVNTILKICNVKCKSYKHKGVSLHQV